MNCERQAKKVCIVEKRAPSGKMLTIILYSIQQLYMVFLSLVHCLECLPGVVRAYRFCLFVRERLVGGGVPCRPLNDRFFPLAGIAQVELDSRRFLPRQVKVKTALRLSERGVAAVLR